LKEKTWHPCGLDAPIEATVSSLEALQKYSMGVRVLQDLGDAQAIPLLKRAIELDPNFPLAYATLATSYGNLHQPSLALEYAAKAYELRDRVSERERLRISAEYFSATGEVEKEAQTYEMWLPSYPRDVVPHANLAANYGAMGQFDKALSESQEALRLAPDDMMNYANLGMMYAFLSRLDEAKATFDQALAHKLDGGGLRQAMYLVGFLRGDTAQMQQLVAWGVGRPGDEDTLLSAQSDAEAYYGRLGSMREFTQRAVDSAVRAGSKEAAALWQANAALREAELGNFSLARANAKAALGLFPGRDAKVAAALTLARSGDAPAAKALLDELAKSYPTNTLLKIYWLPTIHAALKLNQGNTSQALADLAVAAPFELGEAGTFINSLYPAYIRGQAYLLAHNGAAAAAEFQKLLDHRGIVGPFVTGALVHLQLGRAFAMAGDRAKARAAYQDFLTLWKDADRDAPILKQAKVECARL